MERSLEKLIAQLKEMEHKIPFSESKDNSVSQAAVSWHLAHNLKVIESTLTGLERSDPELYRRKFSWKKELIYLTGKIPRGKIKAPKFVQPDENLAHKELQQQIEQVRIKMNRISNLSKNAFIKHPFLGQLNRKDTLRFLVIHTEHHLKIMRDILT